jgi:hypothetical protein
MTRGPMISSDELNMYIRAHWDEILRLAASIKSRAR